MGQKSNILTLRTNYKNVSGLSLSSKEAINSINFIQHLKNCLNRKHIYLTESNYNFHGNTGVLKLNLFYRSKWFVNNKKKILEFLKNKYQTNFFFKTKKKYKGGKKKIFLSKKYMLLQYKKNLNNKRLEINNKIFSSLLNNKYLYLKLYNINKELHGTSKIQKNFIKTTELYKFKKPLFSRRTLVYTDFIKLSVLFFTKKINVNTYIQILGSIFQTLPKKMHGAFYNFIKIVFEYFRLCPISQIQGIKLTINGKLKGKLRSSTKHFVEGKIAFPTISADVDFTKLPVFTMYGCFGFRIWVCYKKNPPIITSYSKIGFSNDKKKIYIHKI